MNRNRIPIILISLISLLPVWGCVPRLPESIPAGSDVQREDLYLIILLANYFKFSQDLDQAENLFKMAVELWPDEPQAYLQAARFYAELSFNIQDPEQARQTLYRAIDICRTALDRFPENQGLQVMLSGLLVDTRQFKEAAEQLRRMIKQDPQNDQLRLELARIHMEMSEPEKTLSILEQMDEKTGESQEILQLKGYANLQLNRFERAFEVYHKLMRLDPGNYEINYNYAILLEQMGQPEESEQLMLKLIARYPRAIDVRFYLAGAYQNRREYAKAIDILTPLAVSSPVAARTRIEIGRLYLLSGDTGQSETWLRDALEIDPGNMLAEFLLALSLSEQSRLAEADAILDMLLRREKPPVEVFDLAAVLKAESGHLVEALRILEEGIRRFPADPGLHDRLAGLYRQNGFAAKAVSVMKRGLEALPGDRRLSLSLAFCLEETGEWQEGIALLEPLLEQNPDDPEISNFIGYTLAEHDQDLDRALQLIETALQADPESGAYLDSMGWVLFKLGRFEAAREYLSNAADRLDTDPLVWDHLAQVLIRLNRYREALQVLDKALSLDPGNQVLSERKDQVVLLLNQ
ncbi:tetratricopeptide repeat protein [bacterium]|nr:tetratricopeptide repeat protein [candidate division CSSED10-310 bacterium]